MSTLRLVTSPLPWSLPLSFDRPRLLTQLASTPEVARLADRLLALRPRDHYVVKLAAAWEAPAPNGLVGERRLDLVLTSHGLALYARTRTEDYLADAFDEDIDTRHLYSVGRQPKEFDRLVEQLELRRVASDLAYWAGGSAVAQADWQRRVEKRCEAWSTELGRRSF